MTPVSTLSVLALREARGREKAGDLYVASLLRALVREQAQLVGGIEGVLTHPPGDRIWRAVSERLRAALEETKTPVASVQLDGVRVAPGGRKEVPHAE